MLSFQFHPGYWTRTTRRTLWYEREKTWPSAAMHLATLGPTSSGGRRMARTSWSTERKVSSTSKVGIPMPLKKNTTAVNVCVHNACEDILFYLSRWTYSRNQLQILLASIFSFFLSAVPSSFLFFIYTLLLMLPLLPDVLLLFPFFLLAQTRGAQI